MKTSSTIRRSKIATISKKQKNNQISWSSVSFVFLLFIVILIISTILYRQKHNIPIIRISNIVMERELVYANKEDIRTIINKLYQHEDMLSLNLQRLVADIEKIDWVKSAIADKQWPSTIKLTVDERIPLLKWGNNEYIDNEAQRFHLPDSPALKSLFKVSGPQGTEARVLRMYKIIHPWFKETNIPINALHIDMHQNWHIESINGINIIIGREHLNERLKKLAVINQNIIAPYHKYIESIDLRYQDGFSVRWKNGVIPKDINSLEE